MVAIVYANATNLGFLGNKVLINNINNAKLFSSRQEAHTFIKEFLPQEIQVEHKDYVILPIKINVDLEALNNGELSRFPKLSAFLEKFWAKEKIQQMNTEFDQLKQFILSKELEKEFEEFKQNRKNKIKML